jgi:pimeloyl-ACP methyl ester carboxylesterase
MAFSTWMRREDWAFRSASQARRNRVCAGRPRGAFAGTRPSATAALGQNPVMVGDRRSLVVPVAGAAIAVHRRSGRAPVVVFEAGLGLPGSCWQPVLAHLPADRGFVYYDRPGLGASRGGRRPRTAGRQLGELRELLGALDLSPPYVLVAHSAGAFVAWLYLLRHPAELAGVVLVDPSTTDEPAQSQRLTDRLVDLATDGLLYGGSVVARTGLLGAAWRWARRSRRLRERTDDLAASPADGRAGERRVPRQPRAGAPGAAGPAGAGRTDGGRHCRSGSFSSATVGVRPGSGAESRPPSG